MLRSHPIDGAVLLGACDKTTPALIMGALSAALPFLFVPGGPMLRGQWRDQTLGSGTDAWKYWAELRAGKITPEDWCEIEDGIARSHGHCMTMGTASTMTAITETLGLTLPGASSIPASDARHWRMAAGKRAAGRGKCVDRFEPFALPRQIGISQCHRRRHGGGRFHECHRASHRHGRARRREAAAGGFRHPLAENAAAGRSPARRPFPHGGFLFRRRPARDAGAIARPARWRFASP